MGTQNPSPVLFGPNNTTLCLENAQTFVTGAAINSNGPLNYLTYGNFYNNATTGWSLGTTGTLTNGLPTGTPTFGSGTTSLTLTSVSSTQSISGYTLSLNASAVTTVGNMIATQAYTIGAQDQAKVLTYKFYYNPSIGGAFMNFSGTSSNTWGVAVWDATNSVWLPTTSAFGMTQGTGTGYTTGTFQTGTSTVSLRLVIYCLNATTTTNTAIQFTDFYLGPQTAPSGPIITDWVAYTPTITGFGTPTAVSFFSRRVGDSLQVRGSFSSGTATAVGTAITLGYNGGNSNVTQNSGQLIIGHGNVNATSTTYFGIDVIGFGSAGTSNQVALGLQSSTTSSATVANGNAIVTSGNPQIALYFQLPIVGWSSNTLMSSDTDTRVISAIASGTSTSVTSSITTIVPTTIVKDTANGYSSGIYTVPVTGYYQVGSTAQVSTANASVNLYILQNSGSAQLIGGYSGVSTASTISSGSAELFCNAGDTLRFQMSATNTSTVSLFNSFINRISGPAVISATESVNARYFSSSTAISSSLATVLYSTKGWDTHAAYNVSTGIYTAPVSGKYQVNASIAMTGTFVLNTALDLQVQQTGSGAQISEAKAFAGGAVTQMNANVGDLFYLLAGDTIKVQVSNTGTAPAIAATTTQNWISIARVGN